MTQPDQRATERTRARYQRISGLYDLMEILPERRYIPWRENLWEQVHGPRVLEIGVGTGKNMPFYPPEIEITAIDLTPGMLARAHKRATELDLNVNLQLGDTQALDFPDKYFDSVIATFVFCSVPDAVLGLREIRRVLKPAGQLFLLEHMRARNSALGLLMDVLNPLVVRMMGANINRHTVNNVQAADFKKADVTNLSADGIFKYILAYK
ncbi:MAG: class I SAM-dependent methyltransferase [Anaerolineae bacterium]|jgi:ubiquinone/menaquinone biosynthesis C-methylase UbiE|nr:class I SAM-dependent methyltransferase [Anaerolineae bacterium]MBT4309620.1 class I SAM-dependent methyltransferase [Anaerolineae bacterium]MBT4456983.1 class I SAM-dependent methyltransferase [Anaerolineae bacterium]MBT4843231.1 class I SAM-dependent methyltransferase [Anaerolineae bacterium]MBT6060658.1 class I SAM-dependent methyltransferase [Anaerolineae bacterium]